MLGFANGGGCSVSAVVASLDGRIRTGVPPQGPGLRLGEGDRHERAAVLAKDVDRSVDDRTEYTPWVSVTAGSAREVLADPGEGIGRVKSRYT